MIKTRVWIVVIVLLAVVSVTLAVVLATKKDTEKTVATVYVDGEAVYSADLSTVESPYEKEIVSSYGKNVLEIEKGRIRIKSADCEGNDCVKTGWSSGAPLVCLPHRLVVRIEGKDGPDTVSR